MFLKSFAAGLAVFGVYIIYVNRQFQDDSMLLGTVLILAATLLSTIEYILKHDSKRK